MCLRPKERAGEVGEWWEGAVEKWECRGLRWRRREGFQSLEGGLTPQRRPRERARFTRCREGGLFKNKGYKVRTTKLPVTPLATEIP